MNGGMKREREREKTRHVGIRCEEVEKQIIVKTQMKYLVLKTWMLKSDKI